MKKIKSLFLVVCLITGACARAGVNRAAELAADTGIASGWFAPDAHIYIVTCGVDDYRALYNSPVLFHSSVNDVRNLADSIARRFCSLSTGSCTNRIHRYTLLDAKATRKGITDALHDIGRQMKANDVLFFSFSGDMRDFVPLSKTPVEYPYLMTYSTDSNAIKDKGKFENEFLGLKELRTYLELLPCKYQMLLLDAGIDQKEIGWKFASTMLKDIPAEQDLTGRKRILIAPEGTSVEFVYDDKNNRMGFLSYVLASYPHTLNLFFDVDRVKRQLEKYAGNIKSRVYSPGYCAVYSEDEVLSYLRKFCRCTPGNTRGAAGTNDNAGQVLVPRPPAKKDLALIVATAAYYGGGKWQPLKTALHDADTIAALLREKYNFETRVLLNYTKDSLMQELKKLVHDSVTDEQQLFLFFAGHGFYSEDNLDGCLVMKNAVGFDDEPNMQSYFQFSYLSNFINNLPYKHIFVMLDVCFGGAFGGNNNEVTLKPQGVPSDISIQEYRKRKKDITGRLYLASGPRAVEDVSRTNPNHSPFAEKIIDKLRSSKVTVCPQDLYYQCERNITPPVYRKLSNHKDDSEFFFTPAGSNK